MENDDFQELKSEFFKHEAVCEERWKTVFNEIRDAKQQSNQRWDEIRNSFQLGLVSLLGSGGALILFLLAIIFGEML